MIYLNSDLTLLVHELKNMVILFGIMLQLPQECLMRIKNKINDQRILSNMLGEYLLSSLTILAQNKVKIEIEIDDWQKTLDEVTYIDGGTLYWHIANIRSQIMIV